MPVKSEGMRAETDMAHCEVTQLSQMLGGKSRFSVHGVGEPSSQATQSIQGTRPSQSSRVTINILLRMKCPCVLFVSLWYILCNNHYYIMKEIIPTRVYSGLTKRLIHEHK